MFVIQFCELMPILFGEECPNFLMYLCICIGIAYYDR